MKNVLNVVVLLLMSSTAHAGMVLLETFTPDNSIYGSGGWILRSDDSYLGIRFTVDDTMYLENIVANLGGVGDFFTGVVELSSASAMPDISPGFDPNSILFYKTKSFLDTTSSDVSTQANTQLTQGDYAVIFGGLGLFGQNDYGWMPGTTDFDSSSIPLTDYLEYRSENNGWVEFADAGIRVVLEGELNPVPLPASFYLLLSGLTIIFLGIRKHVPASAFTRFVAAMRLFSGKVGVGRQL